MIRWIEIEKGRDARLMGRPFKSVLIGTLALLAAVPLLRAAPVAGSKFGADDVERSPNGTVRLKGNAYIRLPELNVTAQTIEFQMPAQTIEKVEARNKVAFEVVFTPRRKAAASAQSTSAQSNSKPRRNLPIHIKANCDLATLVPNLERPEASSLLLSGHVNGFYETAATDLQGKVLRLAGQIQWGARNTLSGDKATLETVENNLLVNINGGAAGVRIELPPEVKPQNPARPDQNAEAALGTVIITSRDVLLNQTTGAARFIGDAHVFSNDGPTKLDVRATEFTIERTENEGAIGILKTTTRTKMLLDLPPDPPKLGDQAPPSVQPAPDAGAPNAAPADKDKSSSIISRPTHVEVEADAVTITRASNTVTLTGNVRGSYRLAPAGTQPSDYPFQSSQAVLQYVTKAQATSTVPVGFKFKASGNAEIFIPDPKLDLGGNADDEGE